MHMKFYSVYIIIDESMFMTQNAHMAGQGAREGSPEPHIYSIISLHCPLLQVLVGLGRVACLIIG